MKLKCIAIAIIIIFCIPMNVTIGAQPYVAKARYAMDFDGSSYIETVTENITYSRKEEAELNVPAGLPKYEDETGLTNICAVLAGANLVGFYDRIYTNLIPDFTPARVIQGKTIYTNSSPKIQEVITSLYTLMGATSTGTTLNGFMSGLSSYASSKGSNITFSDVGDNYAAIQSHITGENLTTIFMTGRFNYVPYGAITTNGNTDTIVKEVYNGNHVALVYGYRIISYYNGSTHIGTKRFLKVNTGFAASPLAYILYDEIKVNNALNIWVQ